MHYISSVGPPYFQMSDAYIRTRWYNVQPTGPTDKMPRVRIVRLYKIKKKWKTFQYKDNYWQTVARHVVK
jgi:hypothetical protein